MARTVQVCRRLQRGLRGQGHARERVALAGRGNAGRGGRARPSLGAALAQTIARETEARRPIDGWTTHAVTSRPRRSHARGPPQPLPRAPPWPAMSAAPAYARSDPRGAPGGVHPRRPYRVIIDLPQVAFRLREADGRTGHGLVSAFRYGQFDADKGRVVLDTTGPVRVESAQMQPSGPGGAVRLTVELAPTDAPASARARVR